MMDIKQPLAYIFGPCHFLLFTVQILAIAITVSSFLVAMNFKKPSELWLFTTRRINERKSDGTGWDSSSTDWLDNHLGLIVLRFSPESKLDLSN